MSNGTHRKRLTFAVPTRNRTAVLVNCLKRIRKQTFKDWDLIIVDDNDGGLLADYSPFQRIVQKIGKKGHVVSILSGRGRNEGFPVHNIALEAAETDLVMRIDDDVLLDPPFVEALMPLFDDLSVGAASGCMHRNRSFYEDQPGLGRNALRFYGTRDGYRWEWDLDIQFYRHRQPRVHEVEHIHSSYIYRKSILKSVGGFDEDLSDDGEETMCQLKMGLEGYKILLHTGVSCLHLYSDGGWRDSPRRADTRINLERNLGMLLKDLKIADGESVKDIIRSNGLQMSGPASKVGAEPQRITTAPSL